MPEEASHEHDKHKEHQSHENKVATVDNEGYNFKITKVRVWQGISAILAIIIIFLWFNPAFGTVKGYTAPTTMHAGGVAAVPNPQQQGNIKFDVPSFVPYRGSDSATVAVIEFGDYQCPFCERFFSQIEPQLMQDYVNSNKVKFYFMDFAFLGPDSETLAQGAWCAHEQGKYYDYHDYVYSHQGQENSGWATPDKVKSMAANIQGLEVPKFSSCWTASSMIPESSNS